MNQADADIAGAIGLWFNKRSVSHFEIAVAHEVSEQPTGWRLEVTEPGKVIFVVNHERVPVDLNPGDFVLARDDDVFVSLQQRRDRPPDPAAQATPKREA